MIRPVTLYLTVLAVLAASSVWLLREVRSTLEAGAPARIETPPLVVDRYLARAMDPDGRPEYTLEGPRFIEQPAGRGSHLERPRLTLYRNRAPAWTIDAEEAWVSPDGDLIRLEAGVVARRSGSAGQHPLVITTREVLVEPGTGLAETAAPARLETPGAELTAVGVRAFLDQDRIHLLSQVRGFYDPKTP